MADPGDPKSHHRGAAPQSRHAYRTRHRAEAHAAAHAEDAHHKPHQPIDHPLVPRGGADLITDDARLADLIDHVRAEGRFGYDSEFIGELTYDPKLCVLQIATSKRVALVDPLARVDLRPFWEVLADESIEKIVHAGEQDIEPVDRLIGRPCANVFDTQIAAGFVGLSYPVSLSKLVGEITGAKLPKGLTFTHWDQRPLSAMQLRYAADDVRYLPAVRDALGQRLEVLGHAAWAKAECDALCDPSRYAFDPDGDFLRVRGAGSLTAAGLAVLRELMIWRDAAARRADVPPRAFLRDEILIDMSRHPVKSIDRLARVKGLPRPVEAQHGPALVDLTLRAVAHPLKGLVDRNDREPTPSERFRTDSLWALVQCLCLGKSIDPNLVASRQDIAELDRLMNDDANLSNHRLFTGWRRAAVGQRLIELVQRGESLALTWKGGLRTSPSPTGGEADEGA
jgi:ribonuclease D